MHAPRSLLRHVAAPLLAAVACAPAWAQTGAPLQSASAAASASVGATGSKPDRPRVVSVDVKRRIIVIQPAPPTQREMAQWREAAAPYLKGGAGFELCVPRPPRPFPEPSGPQLSGRGDVTLQAAYNCTMPSPVPRSGVDAATRPRPGMPR